MYIIDRSLVDMDSICLQESLANAKVSAGQPSASKTDFDMK